MPEREYNPSLTDPDYWGMPKPFDADSVVVSPTGGKIYPAIGRGLIYDPAASDTFAGTDYLSAMADHEDEIRRDDPALDPQPEDPKKDTPPKEYPERDDAGDEEC